MSPDILNCVFHSYVFLCSFSAANTLKVQWEVERQETSSALSLLLGDMFMLFLEEQIIWRFAKWKYILQVCR